MDLLPKENVDFAREKYWDEFFLKRKEDPFEWYGEYHELSILLHKYITQKDSLLVVGCGNSTLSVDLYATGIINQINIDISSVVINQMQAAHPRMTFLQHDVTAMEFFDGTFSCVLDKGTVDALSPPPNKSNEEKEKKLAVDLMLEEISRVVKMGGRFLCISLLQPHIALKLFSYFYSIGWMIRVTRCTAVEEKAAQRSPEGLTFPVFMVVCTKVNLPSGLKPFLEAAVPNTSNMTRYQTLQELLEFVQDQQNMALLKRGLGNLGFCVEKGVSMKLSSPANPTVERYSLHVADSPLLLKNPVERRFGIFIVPAGREPEWIFGTHKGRIHLAEDTGYSRLVVVHLMREQEYESAEKIQSEIGCSMGYFAPLCVAARNIQAPVMTMRNEIGQRIILEKGHSTFTGNFVVEDVTCDLRTFRRLIFLSNPCVIQSEVEIQMVKKKGKEFGVPVIKTLSCQHHKVMTLSFGLLKHFFKVAEVDGSLSALLIGLGGGLLASFLVNFIPKLKLTTVEIDAEIVRVAAEYFGMPKANERLHVVVDDGLKFIQSTESKYNIILIDVDNKSVKEGLSCPPPEFLEATALENMKLKMNPEASIFVLNLVCRNEELKKGYLSHLSKIFPFVYTYEVTDEVNTILFCFLEQPKLNPKNYPSVLKQSIQFIHNKLLEGKPSNKSSSSSSSSSSNAKPKSNACPNSKSSSTNKKKGSRGGTGSSSGTNGSGDQSFDGLEEADLIMENFKLLKINNS